MTKPILVTGSSGFLGESVCRELKKAGCPYEEFDLDNGKNILDYSHVAESLEGCSTCIHLAAVSDLYIADSNPDQCRLVNIKGTRVIANACKSMGVRLLYASTCCVYGNNDVVLSDETSPTKPTELYAETKLEGEEVVAESGCDYTILRLATFYGPNMRKSMATSIFLKNNILGKRIGIHGDGNQTRSYTHVDDISSGIRIVCDKKPTQSIINIADDHAYSVNELITIIEQLTGKKSKTCFVKDRIGQIRKSSINSSLLKNLGWQPEWDLQRGMNDCLTKLYPQIVGVAN
ncbi:MAG: NAD(P)-dependent oxidoreductase [Deltaproteobacteria bacterium]|jgi:UDP-glucose 4-epimerase|nr:NAD(P)-dependent oxidoreductase [Deltaproteobacteria bacterium]